MIKLIILFCLAIGALANIDISLEANWLKAPFPLHLIEAVAFENESLYVDTLSKVIGFTVSDQDEEDDSDVKKSDQQLYDTVTASLDATTKSLVDFSLVNKYHSPRIQAHYQYYNNVVKPALGGKLIKQCSFDSFGTRIIGPDSDQPETWLHFNDNIYCSADEIYALKTDTSAEESSLTPFDRVIGSTGPLMILYGDINSDQFRRMFINLFKSSQSGKLRFVWRYLPDHKVTENERLSGYGVDLTLKRTDYIVIDDRDINLNLVNGVDSHKVHNKGENFWEVYQEDIEPISQKDIEDLGLKTASYILEGEYNATKFEMLNLLLQDFPKYASYMKDQKISDNVRSGVEFNEERGLNEESNGIYVNGSPINKLELDIFKLINKIKSEKDIIDKLKKLGLTSPSWTKRLIQEFALVTAVKTREALKRYNLYKDPNVIFFNDIEQNEAYSHYSSDRQEYMRNLKPGQIPSVKENIHDIIFALHLSDRKQLEAFFRITKFILDNGIAQQVGIIPLVDNDLDELYAKNFLFYSETEDTKEGLTYLFQLLAGEQPAVKVKETYHFKHDIKAVASKYTIESPSVIFNGVFHDFSSQWQFAVGRQLHIDIMFLKYCVEAGIASGDSKLKDLLFQDAKNERNLRIVPDDPHAYTFKEVNENLIHSGVTLRKESEIVDGGDEYEGTFWLVGDLSKEHVIEQLINLLSVMKNHENIHLRIINTVISDLDAILAEKRGLISNAQLDELIFAAKEYLTIDEKKFEINESIIEVLGENHLPHNSFLLFNSRYFRIGEKLSEEDLELLIDHELSNRLHIIDELLSKNYLADKNPAHLHKYDWLDLVYSTVTKSFYVDDNMFVSDVARYDFGIGKLTYQTSFSLNTENADKEVDLLVIVDPLDEYSQKLVSIINSIKEIPFVNIVILLQPKSKIEEIGIKRFYRGIYPSKISFSADGILNDDQKGFFANVPVNTLFTLDLDTPSAWIYMIKDSVSDLDNVKLINSGSVKGIYELKNILIEGYAKDVHDIVPPTGVSVELYPIGQKSVLQSDTHVLSNLGYLQLKGNPGLFEFGLKTNSKTSEVYSLLSADSNPFNTNIIPLDKVELSILNLEGLVIRPRVTKKPGKEEQSLVLSNNESSAPGFLSKLFHRKTERAEINIFTVASGHLYERFLGIMTASVMKHTKHTVKFWLIENYMSPSFKKLLPHLAEKYGFEYELVTYKWPNWLRGQKEKQRTIWGYKILFLDVLFPQDLDKVIFVDADQIVRTDLKELVDLDLEGAPYGYTPMCDTRTEMEGFRFWKQGYWEKMLGDDLKYHISALYVVDLKRFREIMAGDRLRHHYQRLSSDPNSLSNLDQDLPNNLQRHIKIHSLPQEWLWCETWCSDESLKKAKTIDLCNNPLTKEPKLDRARRQVPEWTEYDDDIGKLIEKLKQTEAEKSILNDSYFVDDFSKERELIDDSEDLGHDEL